LHYEVDRLLSARIFVVTIVIFFKKLEACLFASDKSS